MTDPFSIAAGVAALVALAGATSKTFYQFFRSIYNAPDTARELATALYTLNVALSQLQQSLLNPKFVSVGDDEQIAAIEECLVGCTAAFDNIRTRIESSGLASNDQTFPKKAWEVVKASFNEEDMKDCLNRVEREKTTLILVVGVFSARLDAGIMAQIRETKALAQKTDRRLKDIHVFCQWFVGANAANNKRISASSNEHIQTTAFPLSSAYSSSEIQKLLQSSGSTLSLTLSDMDEGSVSAICQPGPQSEVPLKRIVSTIEAGRPPKDSEGFFRSKTHSVPLSLEGFDERLSALKSLTERSRVEANSKLKTVDLVLQGVQAGLSPMPFASSVLLPYEVVIRLAQKADYLSSDIYDDIQYIERSYTMLSRHWIDETADEMLPALFKDAASTIAEYLQWANKIMTHDQVGWKGLQHDVKLVIKAKPNEAERMRLKKLMIAAVEKVRDAQSILASVKSYEMQRQQLDQQERITRQLQMIIDKQQDIEQPQEEGGRVSRERRLFRPSETEPTNIGGGPAAGMIRL